MGLRVEKTEQFYALRSYLTGNCRNKYFGVAGFIFVCIPYEKIIKKKKKLTVFKDLNGIENVFRTILKIIFRDKPN